MNITGYLKDTLNFRTLRSRYIYLSCAFFILVSITAISAQLVVQKATQEHHQQMMDQSRFEGAIKQFSSQHESMKSLLLEFLIFPEGIHIDSLHASVSSYEERLINLRETIDKKYLNENTKLVQIMHTLQKDIHSLNQAITHIEQVRLNAEVNFPFARIMVHELTEVNNIVLGATYDAISSLEEAENAATSKLKKLFQDIQYYWVRVTTEYRLLVAVRFGVFVGDWKPTFNQTLQNIEQYMDAVSQNLILLNQMEDEDQLDFEASESLTVITRVVQPTFESYRKAIDALMADGWRQDILLWENDVKPEFIKAAETTDALHEELDKYQTVSMSKLGNAAMQLTDSLWYLIVGGILVTIIGYLVFDRKILKPIGEVTNALLEEARGNPIDLPAYSSAKEINDLTSAFTHMCEQVNSTNMNLENIVSERTQSLKAANKKLKGTLESLRKTRLSEQQAEKANEAKTVFLANMSHEIRTPMNAILGYTQILQHDSGLNDSQRASIEAINRSGNHLLMLINNILDISKIEAGKMELHNVDFDLKLLIEDLYRMFKARIEGKNLNWVVNINPDTEKLPVHGDEGKLNQILINLMGNAIKFTDTGSVTLNIEKGENHRYLFEVIDTGPGISTTGQENIFDKFQQGKHGLLKGGSGLGLAISKSQIEAMGGVLDLASRPGEGAKFFFTIELPDAKSDYISNADALTLQHIPPGIHIKALVVDDISGNRDVLSKMLSLIGTEVIEAQDGESSITLAAEFKPDIIFMDYHMPGMNGIEALSEIRRHNGDKHKAVIITAHAFEQDTASFMTRDVSSVIKKPFQHKDIYDCISTLLNIELVADAQTSPASSADINTAADMQIQLDGIPGSILTRLDEAIEYNAITDIENIAREIHQIDAIYNPFAQKLQQLASNFDIAAIQELTKGLKNE